MIEQDITFKSQLSQKYVLFTLLKKQPPIWWENVKKHPELYIEIRKDNYINIYYKGGSIAKIEYDEQTDKLIVTTHPKYLGKDDYNDVLCYSISKNGKKLPIYQHCEEWLEYRLNEMLVNVDKYYDSKEKQEQSRMIRSNRTLYIDSEFEHLYKRTLKPDNKYKNDFMRIDLVELRDNTIRFVELKMIGDGRLLKKDENESPEIYDQMQKYRDFAERYKDDLLRYYKQLLAIKAKLGLPVPVINLDTLKINTTPVLVIANDYDRETSGRTNRIKNINKKMMQKSDVFQFEKLREENYANNHS